MERADRGAATSSASRWHPAPTDEDVVQVAASVFHRVERELAAQEPARRAGIRGGGAAAGGPGRGIRPGRHRHRPRRGCPVLHVRDVAATVDAFVMGRLRAQVESYNLQAATRIAANDREALERMGRYLARRLRSRQIGCYSSMTDVSSCTSSAPGEMAPRRFDTPRTS